MTSPLTDDQRLAVDFDRPANLLISAAAGSGKTTTLTERIVERLIQGKVTPSQLLVITFTELAAKDLKVKISSRFRRLRDQASSREEGRRFDQIAGELDLAQISTIHAFCNRVLSAHLAGFCDENGQTLLEPGYGILEGTQETRLLEESIDAVLSDLYARIDACHTMPESWCKEEPAPLVLLGEEINLQEWLSGFRSISLAYSPDLDDKAFRGAIVQMLEQLRNLPDYREFAREKTRELLRRVRTFPRSDDFAAGYWWDLFEEALGMARQTLDDIESSPAMIKEFQNSKLATDQQMLAVVDVMSALVIRLEGSSGRSASRWDEIVEAGRQMEPVQFPRSVHAGKDPVKKEIKEDFVYQCRAGFLPLVGLITDQIKRGSSKDASFITGYPPVFTTKIEAIRSDLEMSAQAAARFMEVVLLLDEEFKRRRFSINAIQFSDIEHGAHQLLKQEEIREDYLSRYKEIYVDEYQDTSSIQDAIIRRIAQNNLLMVGDIKQSIYRFRYANPDLFAGHQDSSCLVRANEATPVLDSQQSGYLALLNRCFRTRPLIIDFINDFFSSFLTKRSGEIDYDVTQQLFADDQKWRLLDEEEGSAFPANVVLEIATGVGAAAPTGDEAVGENAEAGTLATDIAAMSPAAREALMALQVIGRLRRKGVPYDRIAILLPTNENCRDYEEVLVQYGIPVTTRSGEMYPDNLVFRQLEALLSVLDNPRQDFALLSVLLGPFAPQAWSGEELVQVARLSLDDTVPNIEGGKRRRQLFFHDRFFRLCESADHPLAKKAEAFIDRIERWRFLAQELSFRDLLDLVLFETDYPEYIAQATFGESYTEELNKLLDFATEPDPDSVPGIRGALRKMKEMMKADTVKTKSKTALLPGAVRVLTRHSSKGLEWDYVILGRLDLSWKTRKTKPVILLSEHEGLSCATIAGDGMTVVNNPLHEAALIAEANRDRAESWRLLYVAMTRAVHGLYLLLPVDRQSLGDKPAYANIMETIRRQTEDMGRKERAGRAIIPAKVTADLKNDAELLLAYLAARYPALAQQIASLSGEASARSLVDAGLPRVIQAVHVTPWYELIRDASALQPDEPAARHEDTGLPVLEKGDAPSGQATWTPLELLRAGIPFREAAMTPAKVTVTELQRLGLEAQTGLQGDDTVHEPLWELSGNSASAKLEKADMPLTLRTKEKASEEQGALLGTTMHLVFQFLDPRPLRGIAFDAAVKNYTEQLDQLVSNCTLTENQRDAALSFADKAVRWAESDFAGRLIRVEETSGKVYREMPFTLAVPSSRLDPNFPAEETSLVQGMIDLWFVEEDGQAVLVDFKTDRPTADSDDWLRERYGIQIDSYTEAISQATGRRVKERIVWLIREARPVIFP